MPVSISIITAVFNRASTIAGALESVQQQTYAPIEHLVIDGGSSDGTLAVVEGCKDPRIHMTSEPDHGIYDALNKGIRAARGEVIGLVHSDDWLAHERVLEVIARAFEDPAIDGVYGDLEYVSASNPARVIRYWKSGAYHPGRLKQGWMPPHPTLYLRREVFERYGLYDTGFQISADYDAILRYLARGRINLAYIPEVLVKMRVGGESNRSIGRIFQKSQEDLRALRRNGVGDLGALAAKNLRKVDQFIVKDTAPT